MDVEAARALVRARLPEKYEPLLLSFHDEPAEAGGRLLAIGDDYGTTLCCDLGDGHILSVDRSGKLPTRFMNSGIPQLAQCLDEYEKARRESEHLSTDAERLRLAQELRARLVEVDAPALADPDHWWSTICEQMDVGLL